MRSPISAGGFQPTVTMTPSAELLEIESLNPVGGEGLAVKKDILNVYTSLDNYRTSHAISIVSSSLNSGFPTGKQPIVISSIKVEVIIALLELNTTEVIVY